VLEECKCQRTNIVREVRPLFEHAEHLAEPRAPIRVARSAEAECQHVPTPLSPRRQKRAEIWPRINSSMERTDNCRRGLSRQGGRVEFAADKQALSQ